jgi:hypothetical protein
MVAMPANATPANPAPPNPTPADVASIIEQALLEGDVEFGRIAPDTFAVSLPGERRLKTACLLTIGEHAVTVQAFVVRRPDENREQVYEWLLRHNPEMYAVAWSIDDVGDIYLSGKMPLAAVSVDEIDRVLGAVLEYSDGSFNQLLQLGFGSSIRREWAWRVKNGESLANLAAFADFAQRTD